jgi:uncharacterized protein
MQPRIHYIVLAVENLARSLEFYRDGLGLPTQGVVGKEFRDEQTGAAGTIAIFELHGGLMLSLYERDNLAKDAAVALDAPSSSEFSLGYLVNTKEEVAAVLEQAKHAGATVTDSIHERPWGVYSGYFKDPDGHLWEVTWNPSMPANG